MDDNVLYVRMFGEYTLTWNGCSVIDSIRNGETQASQFLQLLLHRRREGVSRSEVVDMLYRDRDVQNISHSLSMTVYNARKSLTKLGLPGAECIVRKAGGYCWNSAVPVVEDAEEFERAVNLAQRTEAPGERLALYMEAIGLYTGEFLPLQAGSLWVAEESCRYQQMYGTCVKEAAVLMRDAGEYDRLETLGRSAAYTQPYAEWERLVIDALLAQGRVERAQAMYRETVRRYRREFGTEFTMPEPTPVLIESAQGIGAVPPQLIQQRLREREEPRGGYLCSYPVFEGLYRLAQRREDGQDAYLVICTAAGSAGEEEIKRLFGAVIPALRKHDAAARYGERQLLILLTDGGREELEALKSRIGENAAALRYHISPVRGYSER